MKTKFTKGPWEYGDAIGEYIWGINQQLIAEVYIDENRERHGNREFEANAHLIAAAPEMYKALEILVQEMVVNYNDGQVHQVGGATDKAVRRMVKKAQDALAKARGEK